MSSYSSADSPKGAHEVEQYKRNKADTSNAIKEFHLLTKSMQQKMTLFKTPQDSRVNHQQLKELTEKGNRLVAKINRRLQDLSRACQGSLGRSRKAEVNKLSNDFKNQLKAFEATCQQLIENEKLAVAEIRKSSRSFRSDDDKPAGLGNYNEDQIYTQAHVQSYNEDGKLNVAVGRKRETSGHVTDAGVCMFWLVDLMRREEDIIQINHQMREVNAAFREVDDMIAAQGEVVCT
jgi:syntaxin 12/13